MKRKERNKLEFTAVCLTWLDCLLNLLNQISIASPSGDEPLSGSSAQSFSRDQGFFTISQSPSSPLEPWVKPLFAANLILTSHSWVVPHLSVFPSSMDLSSSFPAETASHIQLLRPNFSASISVILFLFRFFSPFLLSIF